MTSIKGHLIFKDELTNNYIRAYCTYGRTIYFIESGLDNDLLKFDLLESPEMNLGPYKVQYNKAFDCIETKIPWNKLSGSLQAYYSIDNGLYFIGYPLVYKELYNETARHPELFNILKDKVYTPQMHDLAALNISELCLNDLVLLVEYLKPLVFSKKTSDVILFSIKEYLTRVLSTTKSEHFSYIKHEFQNLYEHPNLTKARLKRF